MLTHCYKHGKIESVSEATSAFLTMTQGKHLDNPGKRHVGSLDM